MLVFISKSGESDNGFIEALTVELGGRADVSHEGLFRLQGTSVSYHETWAYQLEFWPRAQVIVVLLTGRERIDKVGFCGLPFGMGEEVLGSIWGGKPVIFCAATPEALRRARECHSIFEDHHPFLLSYIWNASDRGIKALADFCYSFNSLPSRTIPTHFEVGVSHPFKYNVCCPSPDGWRYVDLSAGLFRPIVSIIYGTHIVLQQPYGSRPECPERMMKQNLTVTDPKLGLIEGSISLDGSGVGHMRVEWHHLSGTWGEGDEYPWGIQLLHWDFTCK